MTDEIYLSAYIPMAIATLVTIIFAVSKHRGKNLAANYTFYSISVLCWLSADILFFINRDMDAALVIHDLSLPFVALTALATLLYCLQFYGMEGCYSGAIVGALAVCPVVTLLLAMFPRESEYLRIGLKIISTTPQHVIENSSGPWFWIHAVYCYILVVLAFICAVTRHKKLPAEYKKTSIVIILGMALSLACNIPYVLNIINFGLDMALVGSTIGGMFMYVAFRENQGMDFINRARASIYNSLDYGVIITDNMLSITNMNQSAKGTLDHIGHRGERAGDAMQAMRASADKVVESDDEHGGWDCYLDGRTYNVKERQILDRRGKGIGAFISLIDVTRNRKLIGRLEKEAGMDALTGLLNRAEMDYRLEMLDENQDLPLAVISGDMNGLKQVNDTYGHQQGDVLLRTGAEVLSRVCPPSAIIGRMGGDEFLVVLPGYTLARASGLADEIHRQMDSVDIYMYQVSMSLGVAAREKGQRMEQVLQQADRYMYQSKAEYKQAKAGAGR